MTEANGSPLPDTRPPTLVARTKIYSILPVTSLGTLPVLRAIGLYHSNMQLKATLLPQHGPAVIGPSLAILVTTNLVSGTRAVDGEFGGLLLGVELKGAATLLVWLSVFLAVDLAIRTLW